MNSIQLDAARSRASRSRFFAPGTRRYVQSLLLLSLVGTQTVLAQSAEDAAQSGQDTVLEAVEVTGSRILRDGYEAPTPLTVIGAEEMQATAPANVADFVNQLPSVAGSATPGNSQRSISNGSAGVNALNLRSLGTERTLVLLDGQRSVGAQLNGVVDVNDFPQQLIERVDIVTGGASAAYGSDALSGVVNFVLDKDFTGFKTDLTGGITGEGDNEEYKASVTFGTPFASERGHLLVSGEISSVEGIFGVPRDWDRKGWKVMNNPAYTPTNGQPERIVRSQVGLSNATLGGIITEGPLRGTAFGEGGVPYQFQYGPLLRDPFMQGGDWQDSDVSSFNSLAPAIDRQNLFTRASFELTDNVEAFAQFSWGSTEAETWCCRQFNVANLTVAPDNAFIPQEVRDRMVQANVANRPLRLGSMHADLPVIGSANERTTSRYVAGLDGSFEMLGSDWAWKTYYQKGITKVESTAPQVTIKSKFAAATDAVFDANGNIVCRSTRDIDPNNGCVPYNLMGIGVNSQEALDYVLGTAWRNERFTQDVAAASLAGEPFDSWAGPVSAAVGAEYRREAVTGSSDPISQLPTGGFFAGNYLATRGSYHVSEAFFETVVPLANGLPFADKLDFNGAVRYTDYSTSGEVVTWKTGLVYSPISDLTFRATRSRDIRAPNLLELFQAGGANTNNVLDPFNGNQNIAYQGLAVGNLLLEPEKADTTGLGVVYQPSWLEGFSASFDWYNIEIKDGIGSISAQDIVDRCFAGNQTFCAQITRDPVRNVITQIRNVPFNIAEQRARGFDIEASYRLPMDVFGGGLAIRALATHYMENYSSSLGQDTAGQNTLNGPPEWLGRMSLTYTNDPLTVTLIARGVSSGKYDNSFIECTSGCPTSTVAHRTIDNNHIDGAVFFDTSISYQFGSLSAFSDVEFFLAINNVADKDPVVVAQGPGGVAYATSANNPALYDSLGRVFRAGVRLKL